jgi:AcrR family transcriptional regulator
VSGVFSWQSPSSRLVLTAVLDTLAEHGWEGLTAAEVEARAGPAGPVLGDSPDLESLVVAALEEVDVFPEPRPTGDLRDNLRALLAKWRNAASRDERIVAALISPALRRPRLRAALWEALDGPLNRYVAAVMAPVSRRHDLPEGHVQTLCWVLRGLVLDRLRSGPRSAVDIDGLVDFLVAGLKGATPWGAQRGEQLSPDRDGWSRSRPTERKDDGGEDSRRR